MKGCSKKKAPKRTDDGYWPIPLKIAYAIDYRDPTGRDDETELNFVFIGATGPLLHKVFKTISMGGYLMRGFRLNYEHLSTWVWRNGHHFWRWVVTPIDINTQMLSLDSLRTLIESQITKAGHEIVYFPDYNKFLNI